MMPHSRSWTATLGAAGCGLCCVWALSAGDNASLPQPGGKPIEMPGLPNVIYVSERLFSGGSPDGDAGFESLKKLAIKTILSVDGAAPDVPRAKKFDMRYVHLPIGYDGVSQQQAEQLARAVRDLPGPLYIHCHHGKHRGPAAAAAAKLCLDQECTVAQAVAVMKRAGTDPHYAGLYAAPRQLRRPTAADLDRAPAIFPETAIIPALAEAMVEIDHRFENLLAARKAGWQTPLDHPDIDPPHEALQLLEHFRELARQPLLRKRPEDFGRWLGEGERTAADLEKTLRVAKGTAVDAAAAEKAFQRTRAACTQCHAKYRDVPQ